MRLLWNKDLRLKTRYTKEFMFWKGIGEMVSHTVIHIDYNLELPAILLPQHPSAGITSVRNHT